MANSLGNGDDEAGLPASSAMQAGRLPAERSLEIELLIEKLDKLKLKGNIHARLNYLADVDHRFPRDLGLRMRHAILHCELGALGKALRMLEQLVEDFQERPEPCERAGIVARRMGLRPLALSYFQAAMDRDPDNLLRPLEVAREALYCGAEDEARAIYQSGVGELTSAAAIMLAYHFQPSEADQRVRQFVAHSSDQQLESLLLELRRLGLARAIETALQDRVSPVPWPLARIRAQALVGVGRIGEARQLLTAWDHVEMSADERVELARLWMRCCRPAFGHLILIRALGKSGSNGPSAVLIQGAHEFGETERRDALFITLNRDGNLGPGEQAAHALRLSRTGDRKQAEGLLASVERQYPAFPIGLWRAQLQISDQNLGREKASHHLLAAGHTELAGVQLCLNQLIAAEQIDSAQDVLDRLASNYAARDLALIRSRILCMDLQFEEAIKLLRAAASEPFADERVALSLVDLLTNMEDIEEAQRVLEKIETTSPVSVDLVKSRLRLTLHQSRHWREWEDLYRRYSRLADLQLKLWLLFHKIQTLSLMGKKQRALRMLQAFQRLLVRLPIAPERRADLAVQSAIQLTNHGQALQSRSILKELCSRGIRSDSLNQAFAHNEAFGSRRCEDFLGFRNAMTNSRHHVELASLPEPVDTPSLRTAVLIHLYYSDLWPEIRERLESLLGTNFRLYVTHGRDPLAPQTIAQLKEFDQNVTIRQVKNQGFDIGAHWQSLEHIDLREFDLVLLLQSKKSRHTQTGDVWRSNLMIALLGSAKRWRSNLHAFRRSSEIGMIGSVFHSHSMDGWYYPEMRQLVRALGMPEGFMRLKQCFEFVAGSMFLIRADLMAEIFDKTRAKIVFEHYDDLTLAKRFDYSMAHAMERALGMYTRWRGYKILWRD